jgi:hypothetical protein
MNKRDWLRLSASGVAFAALGLRTFGTAGAEVLQMEAGLSGSDAQSTGTALYRDDGMKRWLDLSIHNGPAEAAGTVLDVLLQGQVVGRIALDEDGKDSFRFRTNEGDELPLVREGVELQLLKQSGEVLLAGTFSGAVTNDDVALDDDDELAGFVDDEDALAGGSRAAVPAGNSLEGANDAAVGG